MSQIIRVSTFLAGLVLALMLFGGGQSVQAQNDSQIINQFTIDSAATLLKEGSVIYWPDTEKCPVGDKCQDFKWAYELWQSLRQFSNILIVLALFVASVATTLNINVNTYGVKKILPTVLIGTLLANFSYLILDVLLSVSLALRNALMGVALGGDTNESTFFAKMFSPLATFIGDERAPVSDWKELLAMLLAVGAAAVLIAAAFFLVLLLIVRNYIIPILVVLAPLAFLAMALPMTEGIFKKWWSESVRWTFFPAVVAFFVMLGGVAAQAIGPNFMGLVVVCLALYMAIRSPFMMGAVVGAVAGWLDAQSKPLQSRAALYIPLVSTGVRLKNQLGKNTEADIKRLTTGPFFQKSGIKRFTGRYISPKFPGWRQYLIRQADLNKPINPSDEAVKELGSMPVLETKKGASLAEKKKFKREYERNLKEYRDRYFEWLRELDSDGNYLHNEERLRYQAETQNYVKEYPNLGNQSVRFTMALGNLKNQVFAYINRSLTGKEYHAQLLQQMAEHELEENRVDFLDKSPYLQELAANLSISKKAVEETMGAIESQAEASVLSTNKLLRAEKELARQRKIISDNHKKVIENELAFEGQNHNSALFSTLERRLQPLLKSVGVTNLAGASAELGLRATAAEEALDFATKESQYRKADLGVNVYQTANAIKKGKKSLDSLLSAEKTELMEYIEHELKQAGISFQAGEGALTENINKFLAKEDDFAGYGVLNGITGEEKEKILSRSNLNEALYKRQRALHAKTASEAREIQRNFMSAEARLGSLNKYYHQEGDLVNSSRVAYLQGPVQIGQLRDKDGKYITDADKHAEAMRELNSVYGAMVDHVRAGWLQSGDDFLESANALSNDLNAAGLIDNTKYNEVTNAIKTITDKDSSNEQRLKASGDIQVILRKAEIMDALGATGITNKTGHQIV